MTPIMYAARDGHPQVVAVLVAHGAEVNTQDENGYTVRIDYTMFLFNSKCRYLFISSKQQNFLRSKNHRRPGI